MHKTKLLFLLLIVNPVKFYAPHTYSNYHQTPVAPPATPKIPYAPLSFAFPTSFKKKPFPPNLAPKTDLIYRDMVEKRLNAAIGPSYSFKYDKDFSSKEKSYDAFGNIKGCSKLFLKYHTSSQKKTHPLSYAKQTRWFLV